MTTSLLKTARANRIAALDYLDAKRQAKESVGEVFDLSAIRAKKTAAPVFSSRRVVRDDVALAA
ncbi:hypothetical protein [Primorskyibacter sp. S87]|uniref:hypothetical protein n=1 Tax=Primorskyibacter sp. S87 TaxID=3415126 RepID=UPI003C7A3E8D